MNPPKIKPPSCSGCPLEKSGGQFFFESFGKGSSGVMILTDYETPESKVDEAVWNGFKRILSRIPEQYTGNKLTLDDFRVVRVLSCKAVATTLKTCPEALANCRKHWYEEFKRFKPKCIIAVGSLPLRILTDGRTSDETYMRGYQFEFEGTPFIPIIHPRNIIKGKWQMAEVIQLDILKALHIAKHGKYELKLNYLLDPGIPAVQRWVEEFESQPQDTLLSFDIETPYDEDGKDTSYGADDESILEKTGSYKILRISFAWKEKEALSIPFTFPYTLFVQRLMGSPNPKAGWNSGAFDIPRLEANDVEVKGEHIDGMHLWHFFKPSLPMGLKFAANFFAPEIPAWSLLNESNPAFYNAMDSDVALRAILSIRARLISEGRWDIFKRHFVDLSTCLRRMHRRGIGTDPVKREEGRVIIGERIVKTLEKIQTLVPVELKPKHVYKKSKEALQKAGIWNDSFVIVTEEYTLKENETLDSEGFVIRKLKEKPPKKPRVKKEKVEKDVSKKVGRRRKLSSDQQPTNLSLFEAPEIQHPDG